MTDQQTLKLSPIFNRCLLDLEQIGNFDLWSSDREQAMQVLMDTVDAAVAVVNNSPMSEMDMDDSERVSGIQDCIKRIERGEQDPHITNWNGAYYGDVYFLLGLLTRLRGKKLESIDVEIGRLEDRVVEAAVEWRDGVAARGISAKDEPLIAAVDAIITARERAEQRLPPASC